MYCVGILFLYGVCSYEITICLFVMEMEKYYSGLYRVEYPVEVLVVRSDEGKTVEFSLRSTSMLTLRSSTP